MAPLGKGRALDRVLSSRRKGSHNTDTTRIHSGLPRRGCARRPTGRIGVVQRAAERAGERIAGEMELDGERGMEDAIAVSVSPAPIVVGDLVIVTSQLGAGVRQGGNHPRLVQGQCGRGRRTRSAVRAPLRPPPGRCSWSRPSGGPMDVDAPVPTRVAGRVASVHDKHNLASPSPVSDGQTVYAWFGTGQIVALDLSGKVVWQRHLGKEISPFTVIWGHSSSPTVFGDADSVVRPRALVVSARGRQAHGPAALEGRSRQGPALGSTPLVVETPSGPELIVNSS